VEGVDSISADVHKLGYAPKGVSVILYADKRVRRYQTWIFDGWLGGLYGSPNLQGTRSGLPMAAAWAVMQHLGIEGYVTLTANALRAADRMRAAITATDGITTLGAGALHLVALAAEETASDPIDVFALGEALADRGWYHDRQRPPDSLHSTVSNSNTESIGEWIDDLTTCVAEVRGRRTDDRGTSYSTIE
jgi:sphinganine-1-phosphate aldolase